MITKDIPLSDEDVLELMLSQEEFECFPKLYFYDVLDGQYAPIDGYDYSDLRSALFEQVFGSIFLYLTDWHYGFTGSAESDYLIMRVTGKVKPDEDFLARHGYEEY